MPEVDIYDTICADLLHQVQTGVFGAHLLGWLLDYIKSTHRERGESAKLIAQINNRFTVIPKYRGLHVFAKGITSLSNVTGSEYKSMMRVGLSAHI